MELYQIRYFLAVADTLNFTRAAERCFVSQPALTKAVQRLEETLGGRLLERTKNSVQLTPLGNAMLPSFRQIFDGAMQARDKARSLTQNRKNLVRVGVMCTIDFQQVLPGFNESQEVRDSAELLFTENNLEGLTEALDQGDLDLAIMCSPYEIPKRFEAHALYPEHYVLCFGDDHRFLGRETIEAAELHHEHYCYRADCEYTSFIERTLVKRGVLMEVVQKSPREDWIRAFVRANFGVAFMPVSLARLADLPFVTMSDIPIVRDVSVVTTTERPVTPGLRAVVDSLRAYNWGAAGVPA